jgi:adenosylcobinamide-GDP ribazoletransferase
MSESAQRGPVPAIGFLTCVSLRRDAVPGRQTAAWFAPVGAVVGLLVGTVWWGAGELWPPLIAAVLAIAADAALTGLLHLDGLADSADGLLPPLDRERRLLVMADPHTGAFGMVVLVLVVLLRIAALAELDADPLLVAGLWAASRAAMGIALATLPYARPEGGLASAFAATPLAPSLVGGLAALGLVVGAGGLPEGPAAAVGLAVGAAAVFALAARRLGGFTGDVLGAAGVIGETCGLLLAAAEW